MWNSLNAVANKVKSTARVIATEAYETANELRSIHQVRSRGVATRLLSCYEPLLIGVAETSHATNLGDDVSS